MKYSLIKKKIKKPTIQLNYYKFELLELLHYKTRIELNFTIINKNNAINSSLTKVFWGGYFPKEMYHCFDFRGIISKILLIRQIQN